MYFQGVCWGDSGGPVWRIKNKRREIIGVTQGRVSDKSDFQKPRCTTGSNKATKLNAKIGDWILKMVEEMKYTEYEGIHELYKGRPI